MHIRPILPLMVGAIILAGCGGAKNTPLPRDLDKMGSIKPAMDKLTAEERQLVAGYVMRHTIGASLGGLVGDKTDAGIPDGMTLGKAIDEQRKFMADAALEEAKQAALRAKLQAEREAAMRQMREAITVTLVSKRITVDHGYSGIVMDENLEVVFGYKITRLRTSPA